MSETIYEPTIKQLQHLKALAELRNYTKAAAKCNITQSSLSLSIQELERVLNIKLIERTRPKVILSEQGHDIARCGDDVLNALDVLLDHARYAQDPYAGTLHLALIPTIAPYYLPLLLPFLNESYPKLKIIIHEKTTDQLLAALENGQIHMGIMALPYKIPARYKAESLFGENFHVVSSVREPERDVARLLEKRSLLLLEDGHCLKDHILRICPARGYHVDESLCATSLNTLMALVAQDKGITFIPEMALEQYRDNKYLHFAPLPSESGFHREIVAVWDGKIIRGDIYQSIGKNIVTSLKS